MVSLCDLPLSDINEYLGKYGGYCIGLTKQWANDRGFTPVWYCYPKAKCLEILRDYLSGGAILGALASNSKVYYDFIHIFSYIKSFEDPLPSKGYKNYRFYDERELRLVPPVEELTEIGKDPITMSIPDTSTSKELLPMGVKFSLGDIKYIIVKDKKDIEEFRNLLITIFSDASIPIITCDEIVEDIIGVNHNKDL